MSNQVNMRDLILYWSRPEAEPKAIQIDAWLGDLYLGQRTYYSTSMKVALGQATRHIKQYGSLHS